MSKLLNKQEPIKYRLKSNTEKITEDYFQLADKSFYSGSPWTLDQMIKTFENPNAILLLAEKDRKLIGFISAIQFKPESEIYLLVVSEEQKRQGIASNLLRNFLEIVADDGVESVFLEVRESNIVAIDFYFSNGFVKIAERRNYYTNPIEDAVILKLTI